VHDEVKEFAVDQAAFWRGANRRTPSTIVKRSMELKGRITLGGLCLGIRAEVLRDENGLENWQSAR